MANAKAVKSTRLLRNLFKEHYKRMSETNRHSKQQVSEVVQALLERLASASRHGNGGAMTVACEIESLSHWLARYRGEDASELIAAWLDRQNHRWPLGTRIRPR